MVPELRFPGVAGIRVEVNGQVLLRGGDLAAGQRQDTTAGGGSGSSGNSSRWVAGWGGALGARGHQGRKPLQVACSKGPAPAEQTLNVPRPLTPAPRAATLAPASCRPPSSWAWSRAWRWAWRWWWWRRTRSPPRATPSPSRNGTVLAAGLEEAAAAGGGGRWVEYSAPATPAEQSQRGAGGGSAGWLAARGWDLGLAAPG